MKEFGRIEGAAVVLRHALEIDPDVDWIQAHLGEVLRQLGRHQKALQSLECRLEFEFKLLLGLGKKRGGSIRIGTICKALHAVEKTISLKPENAFAFGMKGQILNALNRNDEALVAFRHSLELNPKLESARVQAWLGEILRQLGQYEEALTAFDQALVLQPDYKWAFGRKGAALFSLRRYEEALAILEKASSDDIFALGFKGATLKNMQRYEEALEVLNSALAQAPDTSYIKVIMIQVFIRTGKYQEALSILDILLASKQETMFALGTKGAILYDLGEYQDAVNYLNQALSIDGKDIRLSCIKA